MIRHRNRRLGIVTAAALALGVAITGCSPSTGGEEAAPSDEAVEIRFAWWGTDARHELTNEALDLFEEKNPNITVIRDFGGFEGYRDKLLTQFAGGNPPDVFQLYEEVLREFAERDQLADIASIESVDLGSWSSDLTDVSTINGGLTALQFGLTTQAFVFDTAKFEELGVPLPAEDWTWDDLASTADAVTAASGGSVYGVPDLSGSYQVFEVWAKQAGEDYLGAEGIAFDEKTLASFWQYWADMRASGGATPGDLTAEFPTAFDSMVAGNAASTFIMANQFAAVQGSVTSPLSISRMPGEADEPGQYLRTSMNIAVAKTSPNLEAAGLLVNFLVNDPEAIAILGLDRGVPANPDVADIAAESADETVAASLEIINSVRESGSTPPVPPGPGAGNVNLLFNEIAQTVMFNQASVDDAVKTFFERAAAELG